MHDSTSGGSLPTVMALAYLGDARHALFVREMLVRRGICKSGDLNSAAQQYVTAEAQARMLSRIEPLLLEDELAVYKRAANSGHLNKPKRASAKDYRAATGFEAVIGMLHYIGDEERLAMLLNEAHSSIDGNGSADNKENGKCEELI